jgi:nucleoside-diphosphate-sugar epimerase
VSRRIAVTGARGFIGSHLVRHLEDRGDSVVPLVVRAPCDRTPLVKACAGAEAIVHLGGVVSSVREADFVNGNVESARAVASIAHSIGAHLIHISSLAAAGPAPATWPRGEDDPPSPMTTYGRTKLEGERLVAATPRLRWTILRPGVVYGPRDRGLLPLFRYARRGFLPLVGRPGAAYTFIHVDDIVRAIAATIDRAPEHETIFVGHPKPVGARELLEQVRSATGGRARIVRVPAGVLFAAALGGEAGGRLLHRPMAMNRRRYAEVMSEGFVCRVDRLRDRLGIVARTSLDEGIASTADWYRAAGWL